MVFGNGFLGNAFYSSFRSGEGTSMFTLKRTSSGSFVSVVLGDFASDESSELSSSAFRFLNGINFCWRFIGISIIAWRFSTVYSAPKIFFIVGAIVAQTCGLFAHRLTSKAISANFRTRLSSLNQFLPNRCRFLRI